MGFRIFVLCLQQLRNNWRTALKISWFWCLIILLGGSVLGVVAANREQYGTTLFLVTLLIVGPAVWVGGTIVAIGWHRFVLREDTFGKMLIYQNGWPVGSYILALLRLSVILVMCLIPLALVFVFIPSFADTGLSFVFNTAIAFAVTWLFLRIGLVFPAMAVGERLGFRGSFNMTRPLARDLLVTSGLLILLQTLPEILNMIAVATEAISLLVLLLPISLFFSWVNLFLSIGILTVLYGHLYENRPI